MIGWAYMKQTLFVAFALLLGACSSSDQTATQIATRRKAAHPAFEIRSLLRTLNKALEESEGHSPAGFPDLKHVEVQLQARTEVDASGEVKFLLVTGGVDTTMAHSTSLTLELEAPKATATLMEELKRVKLKSPIAQAIQAAKKAYVGEEHVAGGPLGSFERGDITVEIAFEISDRATASIETGDLLPVGLNASAGVSSGKTHNIKLVYGH
jgi:hypothetical protein